MSFIRTPIYTTLRPVTDVQTLLADQGKVSALFTPGSVGAGGAKAGAAVAVGTSEARASTRDGYLTKVLKYVPVEFVGPFAALIALTTNATSNDQTRDYLVWGLYIAFAVLTPVVFYAQSKKHEDVNKPRWFFYILSIVAFLVWAMAASDQVRNVLDISDGLSEFLLALAAFGIPGADWLLTTLTVPSQVNASPAPTPPPAPAGT